MSDFNPSEYWEKRLNKNFNLNGVGDIGLGVKYNELLYEIRKFAFKHIMRKLDLNYPDIDVLDIGSGTGFYIERWKEQGVKSIAGSDITKVVVNQLSEKYDFAKFTQFDIGENQISGVTKVDFISAYDVLFHIVDDERFEQAIKNIHSLLNDGGHFVISDNFIHGETVRVRHQVSRSHDYMINVIEEAGFRMVKSKPMFVLMNTPMDSKNRFLIKFNQLLERLIRKGEIYGLIAGNLLVPIEKLLIKVMEESPSTEIKVFKKI